MSLSSCILENFNSAVSELPAEILPASSSMSFLSVAKSNSTDSNIINAKRRPKHLTSANRFLGSRIRAVYNDTEDANKSTYLSSSNSSSFKLSNAASFVTGYATELAQNITNLDGASESTLASAGLFSEDRENIYSSGSNRSNDYRNSDGSKGSRFLLRCQGLIKRLQTTSSTSKSKSRPIKHNAGQETNQQWPVSIEQRLTEQRLLANNAMHMQPLLRHRTTSEFLMRNVNYKSNVSFSLWTSVGADGWVKKANK